MFYNSLRVIICIGLVATISILPEQGQSKKMMSADEDWTKVLSKMNLREDRIKQLRQELRQVIIEKKKTRSVRVKKAAIKQIVQIHERLKTTIKEYNTYLRSVKYRFPEKGDTTSRQYLPMRVDTLEDIEDGVGVDIDLTRVRKKMEKKYAPFVPKKQALKYKAKIIEQERTSKPKKKRIRLEK